MNTYKRQQQRTQAVNYKQKAEAYDQIYGSKSRLLGARENTSQSPTRSGISGSPHSKKTQNSRKCLQWAEGAATLNGQACNSLRQPDFYLQNTTPINHHQNQSRKQNLQRGGTTGVESAGALAGVHCHQRSIERNQGRVRGHLNTDGSVESVQVGRSSQELCRSNKRTTNTGVAKPRKIMDLSQNQVHNTESNESLAQSHTNIIIHRVPDDKKTQSSYNFYRPRKQQSKSPAKSPMRYGNKNNNPSHLVSREMAQQQVSTNSTVLYDPHTSSVMTHYLANNPNEEGGWKRESKNHLISKKTFQQSPKRNQHYSSVASTSKNGVTNKPNQPSEFINEQKSRSKVKAVGQYDTSSHILSAYDQSQGDYLHHSSVTSTHAVPTPSMPPHLTCHSLNFASALLDEKLSMLNSGLSEQEQEKRRKIDILNYGRAKRDEIIQQLQMESASFFNSSNQQRAKSSGTVAKPSRKSPKHYASKQSSEKVTGLNETGNEGGQGRLPENLIKSPGLPEAYRLNQSGFGNSANMFDYQKRSRQQARNHLHSSTSTGSAQQRLMAPTKSSQAKVQRTAGQANDQSSFIYEPRKHTGPVPSSKAPTDVTNAATTTSATRKAGKRKSRQERSCKAAGMSAFGGSVERCGREVRKQITDDSTKSFEKFNQTDEQSHDNGKYYQNDIHGTNSHQEFINQPFQRTESRPVKKEARDRHSSKNDLNLLHQSRSAACMQSQSYPIKGNVKSTQFGKNPSLAEFLQIQKQPKTEPATRNPYKPDVDKKSRDALQSKERDAQGPSASQTKKTYYSPSRRLHLTIGSNKKLKVVVSVKQRIQSLSDEEKKDILRNKLPALMIGYKTRRIYNHNRTIRQHRYEFRDLIHFAYTLKQEMTANEGRPGQEGQVETTKQLLVQSLKDLISKRHQFSRFFAKMFESGTEWMDPSYMIKNGNVREQEMPYQQQPAKQKQFLKSSSKKVLSQSRSQFINAGAKANTNLTQKKATNASTTLDRNFNTPYGHRHQENSLGRLNSTKQNDSHFDSMDQSRGSQRVKTEYMQYGRGVAQGTRRTRQQSQMTFGGPATIRSRQDLMISVDDTVVLKMPDGNGKAINIGIIQAGPSNSSKTNKYRPFCQDASEEGAKNEPDGAAENSNVKKHTFLKRGEKTRKVYDPQRAVMMDKMARRNHSMAQRLGGGAESLEGFEERSQGYDDSSNTVQRNTFVQGGGVATHDKHSATPKSAQMMPRHFSAQRYYDKTGAGEVATLGQRQRNGAPRYMEQTASEVFRNQQDASKQAGLAGGQYSTIECPRTPKSGGHMARMREIRDTYQSPYKQIVSQSGSLHRTIDIRGKNFIEKNRDIVSSKGEQRLKSTSQTRCRNALVESINNLNSQNKQPKFMENFDRNAHQNTKNEACSQTQVDKSPPRSNFVSKIPRLMCSRSRERISVPGPRGISQMLNDNSSVRTSSLNPAQDALQSQLLQSRHQNGEASEITVAATLNHRGSFNKSKVNAAFPVLNNQNSFNKESELSQNRSMERKPNKTVNSRHSLSPSPQKRYSATASHLHGHSNHCSPQKLQSSDIQPQKSPHNRKQLGRLFEQVGSPGKTAAAGKVRTSSGNWQEQQQRKQASLQEMNEMIKMQNQQYIQGKLKQTHQVSSGRSTPSNHQKGLKRPTYGKGQVPLREGRLVGGYGSGRVSLRYQHQKNLSDVSVVSQPSYSKEKVFQNKQQEKDAIMDRIFQAVNGHITNQSQQQPSLKQKKPSQNPISTFKSHKPVNLISSVDTITPQDYRDSFQESHPTGQEKELRGLVSYHTFAERYCQRKEASICQEDAKGAMDGPKSQGNRRVTSSKSVSNHHSNNHAHHKLSQRDSIIDQASSLQQLLEKFNPLRGVSFENKYVHRRKSVEKDRVTCDRMNQLINTAQSQESIVGTGSLEDNQKNTQPTMTTDADQRAPADLNLKDSKRQTHPSQKTLQSSARDYQNKSKQSFEVCPKMNHMHQNNLSMVQQNVQNHHNFCHQIGMFDQQQRCLDLGRSSNFDSNSHTPTNNQPSRRHGDSPVRPHHVQAINSDADEPEDRGNSRQQTCQVPCEEECGSWQQQERAAKALMVNVRELDFGACGMGVRGNQILHQQKQQIAEVAAIAANNSSCTSTFRLCPISIKNKSSMSSWQESERQSARLQEQTSGHHQTAFPKGNMTRTMEAPNHASYDQRGSQERERPMQQNYVICSETQAYNPMSSSNNYISESQSSGKKVSQQKRTKYSPLKEQQKPQNSPPKRDKENVKSRVVAACEEPQDPASPYRNPRIIDFHPRQSQNPKLLCQQMDASGLSGFQTYQQNSDDNQNEIDEELNLIMPQILSGPVHASILEAKRKQGLNYEENPTEETNPDDLTLTRRRRSRGDRSRQTNKSRRSAQGCVVLSQQQNCLNQTRGTLMEILSSSNQLNQSLTSQYQQEKPAMTAPEATPKPKRPQIYSKEGTEESPSFSPKKAHQFSEVTTPQNKIKNSNLTFGQQQVQNFSGQKVNATVCASGSRQRLTQTKRSRECQQQNQLQSRSSPGTKTPKRDQGASSNCGGGTRHGTVNKHRETLSYNNSHTKTTHQSRNSTQKQMNSCQNGQVTPISSGRKAYAGISGLNQNYMRNQPFGIRDFQAFASNTDIDKVDIQGSRPFSKFDGKQRRTDEMFHLRN